MASIMLTTGYYGLTSNVWAKLGPPTNATKSFSPSCKATNTDDKMYTNQNITST